MENFKHLLEKYRTKFFEYAKDGNLEQLKLIVSKLFMHNQNNLIFELTDSYGRNIMHWISYYGYLSCFNYLTMFISSKHINAKDKFGYNCLNLVTIRGYDENYIV